MVLKCVELFSGFFAYPPFKLGVFVQSINAISIQRKILIMSFMKKKEKYHHWVYMADDQINHVLKYVIILVFACGGIAIISDLIKRFV